jgi:hypothetical protein
LGWIYKITNIINNKIYIGQTPENINHGYLWRFADDELNIQNLNAKVRIKNKRVIQYTLNGEYVATFDSVNEASIVMNVTYNSIYNACVGRSKSSCGFIWKFESE